MLGWPTHYESTHFGKHSLIPPNFISSPINSISYESWHLQLKFDTLLSIEVAEVEIAVSGGCRSGQGPGKKKVRPIHLKRTWAENNPFSESKSNIWLFIEKWGEKVFSQFSMIKMQNKKILIASFYNFLVPPKGRFGQKTHEIWILITCPIQKWQRIDSIPLGF